MCCDRAADRYVAYLESAGLRVDQIENHDEILNQTAIDLQGKGNLPLSSGQGIQNNLFFSDAMQKICHFGNPGVSTCTC